MAKKGPAVLGTFALYNDETGLESKWYYMADLTIRHRFGERGVEGPKKKWGEGYSAADWIRVKAELKARYTVGLLEYPPTPCAFIEDGIDRTEWPDLEPYLTITFVIADRATGEVMLEVSKRDDAQRVLAEAFTKDQYEVLSGWEWAVRWNEQDEEGEEDGGVVLPS